MKDKYRITLPKIILHSKTILQHKFWVFVYCYKAGIPIRGFLHDISKFSPTEYLNNIKYTEKGISPIDIQKKVDGYSPSWIHHKSHNSHHYEYWMDKFDNGGFTTRMPFKDLLECACDMVAANRVYNGKSPNEYDNLWKYWIKKRNGISMHPDNVAFLNNIFLHMKITKKFWLDNRTKIKSIYTSILSISIHPLQMPISEAKKINTYADKS